MRSPGINVGHRSRVLAPGDPIGGYTLTAQTGKNRSLYAAIVDIRRSQEEQPK